MHPECETFRSEHADRPVDPVQLGASAREHLARCAECGAWVARLDRLVRTLTDLPRVDVPAELDGRVVAAMFSGERQTRAVRSVLELGSVAPPRDLDERLHRALVGADQVPRLEAPEELDRRVDRDLRDPAARVARLIGHVEALTPMSAPAELQDAVARRLEALRDSDGPKSRPFRVARWALAAAAGVLALLGSGELRPASSPPAEPGSSEPLSFRIVPVSEPGELSGMARALILPASGGILWSGDEEL